MVKKTIKNINTNFVAISIIKNKRYPNFIPYNPPVKYPEYFGEDLDPENYVYAGVREMLWKLGLDYANFNAKNWNPFGEIIRPGMTVFIKPNLVSHFHEDKKNIFSIIIHASIIRPILDYICIALKNEGKIIIGDSPLIFTDFEKVVKISKIKDLIEWYKKRTKIPIEVIDLRIEKRVRTLLYGRWGKKKINMDPMGYQFINLGNKSCFNGIEGNQLRIAIGNYKNMEEYHSNGNHEYLFPKSFLNSDVVINISKLKTHRRTGVTLALKNAMGIPSWKDTLPHFKVGSKKEGGDQYIYPSLRKRICTKLNDQIQSNNPLYLKFIYAIIKKIIWNTHKIFPFKDDIYEAMWPGNDTLWRTLIDLNRAILYTNKSGIIYNEIKRQMFCIIDGIIGGEGGGPLSPKPINAGILIGGFHPVPVDIVGATIMGFDIEKIPLIKKSYEEIGEIEPLYPDEIENIEIILDKTKIKIKDLPKFINLKFRPHPNWEGNIEI